MGALNFDATEVSPNQGFDPLPAGNYHGQVVASEVLPTSSGSGEYLKLEIEILDEKHKGRKIFDNLNIRNESSECERIGRAQLSALCHAIGVLRITDSTLLHDKPFLVKLTVKKDESGQYGDKNEVRGYKKIEGTIPSSFSAGLAPASPPAESSQKNGSSAPPWLRNKAS